MLSLSRSNISILLHPWPIPSTNWINWFSSVFAMWEPLWRGLQIPPLSAQNTAHVLILFWFLSVRFFCAHWHLPLFWFESGPCVHIHVSTFSEFIPLLAIYTLLCLWLIATFHHCYCALVFLVPCFLVLCTFWFWPLPFLKGKPSVAGLNIKSFRVVDGTSFPKSVQWMLASLWYHT